MLFHWLSVHSGDGIRLLGEGDEVGRHVPGVPHRGDLHSPTRGDREHSDAPVRHRHPTEYRICCECFNLFRKTAHKIHVQHQARYIPMWTVIWINYHYQLYQNQIKSNSLIYLNR